MRDGCIVYQVKISAKQKKNAKFRWLASDINFKLLRTGCPIAHGSIKLTRFYDGRWIKHGWWDTSRLDYVNLASLPTWKCHKILFLDIGSLSQP